MKTLSKFFLAIGLLYLGSSTASANSSLAGTAYVATANGSCAYSINNAGKQLFYDVQPDTDYNWYNEDGSLVTYTKNGVTANRDGMKTFASTDVAYGAKLKDVSLSFQYASDSMTDSRGYVYGNYPTMNIHITDGNGNYAIWSATSGGTGFAWQDEVSGRVGWKEVVLDCSTFDDDSVYGKINESTNTNVLINGNLNSTSLKWSDIKDWTIAGFYDEQFTPTGGWGAWGQTLWGDLNEAGDDTIYNKYGISLVWGDTVGSMYGDYDNSYVGSVAEQSYGYKVKMIDNLVVGVGCETYDITFVADTCGAVVPAPGAVLLAGFGTALIGRIRRHMM